MAGTGQAGVICLLRPVRGDICSCNKLRCARPQNRRSECLAFRFCSFYCATCGFWTLDGFSMPKPCDYEQLATIRFFEEAGFQ